MTAPLLFDIDTHFLLRNLDIMYRMTYSVH